MTYKDLKVYQRAYKLAIDLHILLKNRIQEIDFTLANHLKREVRDALGHIADGFTRRSDKAKRYGYVLAAQATQRILLDIDFMKDIKSFPEEECKYFIEEYGICIKQLYALVRCIGASASHQEGEKPSPATVEEEAKQAVAA